MGFIEKYVCCENCHLPEIDMAIKKGMIIGKCMACGWQDSLDNLHKLAAFITKNPPDETGLNLETAGDGGGEGKKLSKEDRRKAKLEKAQKKDDSEEDQGDDGSDDEEVKK